MPDLSQILERAPSTTLAEIKPGDTVLVAGSKGNADRMTAITMLANAQRFVDMRRAAAARSESSGQRNQGPGGQWNLDSMSMIPIQ
jgi:hypothetical protein